MEIEKKLRKVGYGQRPSVQVHWWKIDTNITGSNPSVIVFEMTGAF